MKVLVDTSVWVAHFRKHNDALTALLQLDLVATHPMIIGELACGTPPAPRERTLSLIGALQTTKQVTLAELMRFIEQEQIYGLGCGFVDMALLVSTLITPGASLWTLDRRLASLAERFGVAHA